MGLKEIGCLTAESVQGTSLPLEGIDNVHGGDGLPLGVFGVGDGIPDDVLKEDLEDSTGLLVDESRDTLDSTTTRQTPDGGLGDALDVISQHLTVTLGASLSKSLASFATSSHCDGFSSTDTQSPNPLVFIPGHLHTNSTLFSLTRPFLSPPGPSTLEFNPFSLHTHFRHTGLPTKDETVKTT